MRRLIPSSMFVMLAIGPPGPTLAAPASADPAAMTVYRCTDARGRVELRDSPCAQGKQQQRKDMVRPKDPPPGRPTAAAPASPASPPSPAAPIAPSVVMVNAPRPLYECTTPDGDRYTSDSGEGNPRWQPLWTLGYPVVANAPGHVTGTQIYSNQHHLHIQHSDNGHLPNGAVLTAAAYGAGTWVRDACHALPQGDVCARLRQRRSDLGREFFNAQPSRRERLAREERSLDARLAADCTRS